jgi:tripartite-type tricarboxylate transporter receptor subunit TctC
MGMMHIRQVFLAFALIVTLATAGLADTWPSRPVKIVLPGSAGITHSL